MLRHCSVPRGMTSWRAHPQRCWASAGTTSITEALNQLEFHTHHFCAPMVKLERRPSATAPSAAMRDGAAAQAGYTPRLVQRYSDAFDGQTDLAPVLVLEQLLHVYPTAKFVYTTRPVEEWASAMVRFVGEEPRRSLFRWHPTPSTFYSAAYGADWASYTCTEWAKAYKRHDMRVRQLFTGEKAAKLLELDITQMAKDGHDSEIWAKLCSFIGVPNPSQQRRRFPHRLVFYYSAVDQPLRSLRFQCPPWSRRAHSCLVPYVAASRRQVRHAAARMAAATWLLVSELTLAHQKAD